ncbi:MAG: hypothetical protein IJE66_08390 [Akkermansia sp.]|nr:hypothetical protein [Akkermansia sp.]
MKKHILTLLAASLPALATEAPPMIPDGPVEYESISYDSGYGYDPTVTPAYDTPAADAAYTAAPMPAPSSEANGSINLNVYTSNYQVRGMGFCNALTEHGFSSLSGSYTLPNRNYFNRGIQQRFAGEIGVIWGAGQPLGDTPLANVHYAMGKEIFPNLLVEVGSTFRRGGMEGYMAHVHDGSSHRATWEFDLCLTYNDKQRGFFGSATWGIAVWGLTGSYFDAEIGYRFTDVINTARFCSDLELSAGIAPSVGYWGSNVEGVDAYRVKVALCPFSPNGGFGRDGRTHIKPWLQCAWSGSTSEKMANFTHYGPVDHFQITVGVDLGWKF